MRANKNASPHSWKSDLTKVDAHVVQPHEYEEAPELTDAMVAKGVVKRRGRPVGSTKESTTIRLDHDVLEAFRASGDGWQTRMNAALKDWLKTHSPSRV